MDLDQGHITANGLDIAYLEAGEGPLALCLHGFPDSAHTWRRLLPELAAAGYHAVAPWLRGYAPTEAPGDASYQAGAVAADANALHEVLAGDGDAVIIGHDLGAIAAYPAVNHQPDRWRKAVTLAVPPLAALGAGFLSYDQLKRSWYIFFFQSPIAEMAVAADDFAFLDRLWADWSPGFDGRADLAPVKDALRDPANLTAALAFYRTSFGSGPHDPAFDAIEATAGQPMAKPTLYLHGVQDGCLGSEVVAGAEAHLPAPGSRMEIVPDAGHFLHLEKPEIVNRLIVDFLQA
ncbi:MAG TPA: alpha/beta hydrolase [Acidimicrobiales bacterium]